MALAEAGAAGALANLQKLSIASNQCGDEGLLALSATLAPQQYSSSQTGASLPALSGFNISSASAGLTRLSHLDLSHNRIGDAGMGFLSDAIRQGGLQKLAKLYANQNRIGDRGVVAFARAAAAAAGKLASMEELWLSNNQLTSEGAGALFAAFSTGAMPLLGDLRLQFNSVDDAGVAALAEVAAGGALGRWRVSPCPTAPSTCAHTLHHPITGPVPP